MIHRHGSRAPANILPYEDVSWNCPGERSVLVDRFGEPFENDSYQIEYENDDGKGIDFVYFNFFNFIFILLFFVLKTNEQT